MQKKLLKIKVLISYPSGHVEVRSPEDRKTISLVKNIALKQWEAVANAIFDVEELKEELPTALKRRVSAEFKEYCKTDSVLKGCDPEQLSAFSNRLVLHEVAIFCPLWNASVSGACGQGKDATNHIALATSVVARCRNALMSAIAYRISMILYHSAARHADFQRLNQLGVCMSASRTVALQRKMGANFDSQALLWKKEIEQNKASIQLIEEIKNDQAPDSAPEGTCVDITQHKLENYPTYNEERGKHVAKLLTAQNPHLSEATTKANLISALTHLRSEKLPVFKLVLFL